MRGSSKFIQIVAEKLVWVLNAADENLNFYSIGNDSINDWDPDAVEPYSCWKMQIPLKLKEYRNKHIYIYVFLYYHEGHIGVTVTNNMPEFKYGAIENYDFGKSDRKQEYSKADYLEEIKLKSIVDCKTAEVRGIAKAVAIAKLHSVLFDLDDTERINDEEK